MKKKSSGANIPEAQRKTVARKLRLSPEADAKLKQLTAESGLPASRLVEQMIAGAKSRKPRGV